MKQFFLIPLLMICLHPIAIADDSVGDGQPDNDLIQAYPSKPTNGPVCSSTEPTENCCFNYNDSCYNDTSCFESSKTVWCQYADENGANNPESDEQPDEQPDEELEQAYPSYN